ncbi:hypothetical protein JCM17846_25250 [Iodidimonas nitroreducens]|uniref:Uncharacterized protein n=1 Tax=Iodidimonas nitroreducens TaxID=1236968 RepID=A0A5A7N917_9PROT|nr:hypothetical protein JCM17846_25250 [Iodidimonas nitroreducens]
MQRGFYDWSDVERFSGHVERHVDAGAWRKWGSEQVTVNFHIANTPDPVVLKMPVYTNHREDTDISRAAWCIFWAHGAFMVAAMRIVPSARC